MTTIQQRIGQGAWWAWMLFAVAAATFLLPEGASAFFAYAETGFLEEVNWMVVGTHVVLALFGLTILGFAGGLGTGLIALLFIGVITACLGFMVGTLQMAVLVTDLTTNKPVKEAVTFYAGFFALPWDVYAYTGIFVLLGLLVERTQQR